MTTGCIALSTTHRSESRSHLGPRSVFDRILIVNGRGLHGLIALGSVSERVAHLAPSSVLVVR